MERPLNSEIWPYYLTALKIQWKFMKFQAKSDEYWHFGTLGGGPTHRPHGRYSHPRGVLARLQALPYRGEGTKTPRIRDQEPALCVFRRNGGRIGFRNYMKFQSSNLKFSDTIWIERPLDSEIYTGYLIWLHWNFNVNFVKSQAESHVTEISEP